MVHISNWCFPAAQTENSKSHHQSQQSPSLLPTQPSTTNIHRSLSIKHWFPWKNIQKSWSDVRPTTNLFTPLQNNCWKSQETKWSPKEAIRDRFWPRPRNFETVLSGHRQVSAGVCQSSMGVYNLRLQFQQIADSPKRSAKNSHRMSSNGPYPAPPCRIKNYSSQEPY